MDCHNGLVTVHYPIKIQNSTYANLQTTCGLSFKQEDILIPRLADLSDKYNVPIEPLTQSVKEFSKISKKMANNIQIWLDLIVNYLYEISSDTNLKLENNVQANEAIVQSSSVEFKIRSEIGRICQLPIWRSSKSTGGSKELIEKVGHFMMDHYDLDLNSQIMSQALGFESSYFSKIFKTHNKEGFNSFLKRLRLNQAKLLIMDNQFLSIKKISEQCGFSNPAYFTNVFSESFGLSPMQYKEKHSPDR